MKKIIVLFSILFFAVTNVANASLKSDIDTVISQSDINKGTISVSVKNFRTGKTVYALHQNAQVSPASTQKIITATPAFMELGEDYKFSTKLYKDNKNNYVIVLGADPYLTSRELERLVKSMPKEPASVCIDSSVIDYNLWGEGWQWDDDLNPLMPKFSAYNLDKNLIEVMITPTVKGYSPIVKTVVDYPMNFINKMKTDKVTDYTVKRQNNISPDTLILEGTISEKKSEFVKVPINNPKKYFEKSLSDAIINHDISCNGIYRNVKINKNYTMITLLSHDIDHAKTDVYKNSNNMVAETVFKLAGGKYAGRKSGKKVPVTGSFANGKLMFDDFCRQHKIDTSDIKITDASGVSKNNLVTADFMTDFLLKTQGCLESELPTAGEGTLSNRMLYLRDNLRAKTGTLNNISAITGYVNSKRGQKYVFCIMINDSKSTSANKKILEEYIIRTIYSKG